MEALPVHVSAKAYLGFKDWLSVGYALWEAVPGERDFFSAHAGRGSLRHPAD